MTTTDSLTGRIRDSIMHPPVRPGTGQARRWAAFNNLVLHIHPRKIPVEALRITRTWGLGGISAVLFLLLALSGAMLMFVYEPFPEKAYQSILILQHKVLFGRLLRNIHYWSANALIIVSFLHLLRVFFTGGFHTVRRLNWGIGIFLFIGILLSNFTGYLLPWDQLAYWAVTVSTGMTQYIPLAGSHIHGFLLGGHETAAANLLLFFTCHTTVLPALMILLMGYHFWRVRKAGGIIFPFAPEDSGKPRMADTIPSLVLREGVTAIMVVALVLLVSMTSDAPLGNMANPGLSPNPAKAPWYFLGFQELLMHFHPVIAVFAIPVFLFILILFLPYLKYDSSHSGEWFISATGRKTSASTALTGLVLAPAAVVLDEYFVRFQEWLPGVPAIFSDGLIPVSIVLITCILIYLFIRKYMKADVNEARQALFVLTVVSFVVLTLIGIWFRGEGMGLSILK